MTPKGEYICYYFKNVIRSRINTFNRFFHFNGEADVLRGEYLGKKFKGLEDTNERIARYILAGEPFLVSRYGATELNMLCAYFEKTLLGRERHYQAAVNLLCETAGFFPADGDLAVRFAEHMLSISNEIDLLGVWNLFMEDYICEQYAQKAEYTILRNLEPYYVEKGSPWTQMLAGKKVLVIHPFTESILRQYEKRNEIWRDRNMLPQFEIKTVKAVQTMADQVDTRFCNWFDALNYMIEECKKIEFEIALIGCGAYGMPLAAEIKRMGKGAIHLGGSLQILFGIKGNRWDAHPVISKFYNESWIRPTEQLPRGAERVENACYW